MKRRLHLIPQGGLANRLRAINSGFGFAADLGIELSITWMARPECNCRFNDLFKPIPGVTAKSFGRVPSRILDFSYDRRLPSIINRRHFLDNDVISSENGHEKLSKAIAELDVTLRTTCDFSPNKGDFSWLRLDRNLEQAVEEVVSQFKKNTIGVHVRRGDNAKSVLYSPLQEFITLLHDEVSRDGSVQFYLATDCVNTERDLRDCFNGRILSRSRELRRDSPKGIKDALIDIVCLSRTRKIYGSYWSSFSEVASQIGQIPLRVVSTLTGEMP